METQTKQQAPAPQGPRAAHDPDTPPALIAFMATGWAEVQTQSEVHPQAERFRARRAALSSAFPGAYLLIHSGSERVRANDTNFRFRCSSDFAYLAGPGEPGALLVLEPRAGGGHDSLLFVPAHNRGDAAFFADRVHGELWVGRHRGVDESRAYFGVDRALPMAQIESYTDALRRRGDEVREVEADEELAAYLAEMRLTKDEYEIAELRSCVEISKRAFEDVLRILPRARSEREIEAAFWSRARIDANDVGYLTIAAASDHACTLHWSRNTGAVTKGDLLLLDAGVEVASLYTADITRTFPIGGRYTPEQRQVYALVYEAQRQAMEQVKPGNDFLEPNRTAMKVLTQGLIDMGILRCSLDEALDPQRQYHRRYTLHGVSHMLGIDVHDCARARAQTYRYGTLREGMVLTVEPGLYFQPDDTTVPESLRGIGVRIEDDVLVTASGFENLSSILPSEPDAVERWMAQLAS